MVKIGVKIFHTIILLMTLMALIGVNVKQLCCCHADSLRCEIQFLPSGDPCGHGEEGCPSDCCEDLRHDFYKIAESSRTEQHIQLEILFCEDLPGTGQTSPLIYFSEMIEPDTEVSSTIDLSRAFLCIFQC